MIVLVMLEVFQQYLYNQFRLLPLTIVNAVTLAVFLLVGGLVVPQGPDGLDSAAGRRSSPGTSWSAAQ